MADPRATARLASIHATLQNAIDLLMPLATGPEIDMATDIDIANALGRLRLARDRIWHETSRGLDVLERHEIDFESRTTAQT